MKVKIERLQDVPLQVVHTADGDAFYNLADISERLNVKPDLQNGMQKSLMHISGQIVWGWRLVGGNFVESVFVDQACAEQLLFEGLTTELQT